MSKRILALVAGTAICVTVLGLLVSMSFYSSMDRSYSTSVDNHADYQIDRPTLLNRRLRGEDPPAMSTSRRTRYSDDQPWLLHLARGFTVNMLNLTSSEKDSTGCKRLPSWRSNEKRYIRLQADRDKMKNCSKASGLPLSQRFGLRVVSDILPTSHRHHRVVGSDDLRGRLETDDVAHDADDVAWMMHEAITSLEDPKIFPAGDGLAEDDAEWERWYSLVSIASSPHFLWEPSSSFSNDDSDDEATTFSIAELLDLKRLTFHSKVGDEDDDDGGGGDTRRNTGRREKEKGRLAINTSAIAVCPFNQVQSLMSFDVDPFSMQGYELVDFLTAHAFAHYGWVTLPVAGSALGAVRHRGMLRGDDDMDLFTYPPAKFVWRHHVSFDDVYEDYDDMVETFGAANKDFTWFRSNDYRNNNRSLKPGPWYTRRDLEKRLPNFSFSDYHLHLRQANRVCGANYATWDLRERRRLFQTESCLANHLQLCLQPSQFLYRTHDEILERHLVGNVSELLEHHEDETGGEMRGILEKPGAMMFTAFHKRPIGKICRCRFGHREKYKRDDPEGTVWALCPENLPDLVTYWYDGKWCVASGAVRTRKWFFLKSWND